MEVPNTKRIFCEVIVHCAYNNIYLSLIYYCIYIWD